MCALLRKIAEILRFFAPKNFRGLFHKIGIAKVLLTRKPRGVVNSRKCELPSYRRAEILRWEKKGSKIKQKLVLRLYASTDDLITSKSALFQGVPLLCGILLLN